MMLQHRSAKIVRLSLLAGVIAGCTKSEYPMNRQNRVGAHRIEDSRIVNAPLSEPPNILPKTHLAAGRLFERQGLLGKAIEQYRKAIAVSHDNTAAYHRLGLALSRANRHDDAIGALHKAVELDPKNAVLRNDLGFELMYRDEWGKAEAEFRRAIDLNPTLARAQINLGLSLSKQGRFEEALKAFQTVLPDADAHYNLGLMYRAQKRYADAERTFRHVLTLAPKFTAATVQLEQMAARTDAVQAETAVVKAPLPEKPAIPVESRSAARMNVASAPAAARERPEATDAEKIPSDGPPDSRFQQVTANVNTLEDDALPRPDVDEARDGVEAGDVVTLRPLMSGEPEEAELSSAASDPWSCWRERWNTLALSLSSIRDEIECLDAVDAERELQPALELTQRSQAGAAPVLAKDHMSPEGREESRDETRDRRQARPGSQTHEKDGNSADGRVGLRRAPVDATARAARSRNLGGDDLYGPPAELAQGVAPRRHELVDLPRRRDHLGPVPH